MRPGTPKNILMNNFNEVFAAVKEVCGTSGVIEDTECFRSITKKTGIQPHRLIFYLDTLESIGLIKYNADRNYIKLTEYGMLKKKLFMD